MFASRLRKSHPTPKHIPSPKFTLGQWIVLATLLSQSGALASPQPRDPAFAQPSASSASPASPASPASSPADLASIDVVASATPLSPLDSTALKLPGSLHETPRNITVFDAETIRELNLKTPVDAMDFTPGVFPNSRNAGGYHFIARGYRMTANENRLDGFRGIYAGSGQNALPLYGIEKVVFLQGPSSLLYGAASSPGGMINLISQKPQAESLTSISSFASTYAGNGTNFRDWSYGGEFNSTGPVSQSSDRLLYRTVMAAENSASYTAGNLESTRFFQSSLTYKLDPEGKFSITPIVQFVRTKTPAGAGMVVSPTSSLSTHDGSSWLDKSNLSPLDVNLYGGGRRDEMLLTGFDFNAKPDSATTFYAGYRYIDYSTRVNSWSPVVSSAAQREDLAQDNFVSRTQTKYKRFSDSHHIDLNLSREFLPADSFKTLVQAGFNARYVSTVNINAAGPLSTPQSPIDVSTGQTSAPLRDLSTGWKPAETSRTFEWNAYLQNQSALLTPAGDNKLILTLGLGLSGQHVAGSPSQTSSLIPNIGLLYNLTPKIAAYTSFSTSYSFADPTTIYENSQGATFLPDPTTGRSFEVGLKWQDEASRTTSTLCWFNSSRNDVVYQSAAGDFNPNGNRYYYQAGGQESWGVEWSGQWRPTPNWLLQGSFAWIDGKYDDSPYGAPLAKTPEFSFSLLASYTFTSGWASGISPYVAAIWQDERLGGNGGRSPSNSDPLMLPSFWRLDAGINYAINSNFSLGFHVQNLLDEVIFVDGTTGANLQIAAPRTLSLRATYTF